MRLRYDLSLLEPHRHLCAVGLELDAFPGEHLDLMLPAWTPGAYKIVDNARNLRGLRALSPNGEALPVERLDMHTWRVRHNGAPVRVSYQVFANKLQIHQAQLNADGALLNGCCLFVVPTGGESWPCELRVEMPDGWDIATSLVEREPRFFEAATYDDLIDCPIQAGRIERVRFEALGVPHEIAWTAPCPMPVGMVEDLRRIVEVEAAFWGDLPYVRYLFHYLQGPENFLNGLEHKSSMVIIGPMDLEKQRKNYLVLTAHEVFHAWNVKRLRPLGLGPFDYRRAAHTTALWVVEGLTEYYADLLCLRAGLISRESYLQGVAENLLRLEQSPGRRITTLEEASFITWNFGDDRWNGAINYYLKGALVGLALDLEIRHRTRNERSLDDVMRALWQRFGATDTPYEPHEVEDLASTVTGLSLEDFFECHLRSCDELDLNSALAHVGMRIGVSRRSASLEARTSPKDGGLLIEDARAGGAAQEAGLMAGDILMTLAGERLSEGSMVRYQPGDRLAIGYLRGNRWQQAEIVLGDEPAYVIEPNPAATHEQVILRESWLSGAPIPVLA